jgi:hypothetical protein
MLGRSSRLPGGKYSGLIVGKYVVATEEGGYNVKVYDFESKDAAQQAFNSVPCCCILFGTLVPCGKLVAASYSAPLERSSTTVVAMSHRST